MDWLIIFTLYRSQLNKSVNSLRSVHISYFVTVHGIYRSHKYPFTAKTHRYFWNIGCARRDNIDKIEQVDSDRLDDCYDESSSSEGAG